MMVLRRDVELDVSPDALVRRPFDADGVRDLFKFLEFRTLYERLVDAVDDPTLPSADALGVLECGTTEVADAADATALLRDLAAETETSLAVAAAWEGSPGRSPLAGLALVTSVDPGEAAWVRGDLLVDPEVRRAMADLTALGGRPLDTHNAKPLMRSLGALGIDVRTLDIDTEVASYLLDPAESGTCCRTCCSATSASS
jgi:DNA polymerase-1